jgi:hypothetical protein
MVLTASFVLSGDRALLSPSPVQSVSFVTELTPASRRQDHTTSPSAEPPVSAKWRRRASASFV